MQQFKKFLVPGAIVLAVILIAAGVFYMVKGRAKVLSAQDAAKLAIDYINNNMLQEGYTAVLVDSTAEGSMYKFRFKIGENEYTSYISKDGGYLFPTGYNMSSTTAEAQEQENNNQTSTEVAKSDKPDLKLFVMSYCPYGLQAEKMYLPVYNLLKEKADIGIYFVSYIMHGEQEMNENLRQYCIQRDQKDKYYSYLSCFVKSGKYEDCLTAAKIDSSKLSSCQTEVDGTYNITAQFKDQSTWLSGKYPKFDVEADLNTQYGVQGSPTIILNGKEVNISPRSPETLKQAICAAFNSVPAECSEVLSTTSASTGFGDTAGSASADGSCE
jgi:hypothetical protein